MHKKLESGQSLFEVLLALAVFVIAIATIAHLFLAAHYSAAHGVEKSQAVLLAKEGLEAVRSIRDDDFENIEAKTDAGIVLTDNKWAFQGTPDITGNKFTRKINITSVPGYDNAWQVESAVEWTSITGKAADVSFTERLTAWRLAAPHPWEVCGDDITFIYKGEEVTYGTVESLGECWMDRNLGASQVATAYNDSAAYGDLFQWGRLDDGHQTRTSGTTGTCSSGDNPGHSNFITTSSGTSYDWRCTRNNNLWQGVDSINNPCPDGWRIPTEAEWDTERASWSEQNRNGAYASPLKLTAGSSRYYFDGSIESVGYIGIYWSSDLDLSGSTAYRLYFSGSVAYMSTQYRGDGESVRCVKD